MASWNYVCARVYLNYIKEFNTKYIDARERTVIKKLRNHILIFCERIKTSIDNSRVDKRPFIQGLIGLELHLDIIWIFINCGILEPTEYFTFTSENETACIGFGGNLAELVCTVDDVKLFEKKVLCDMMGYLDSCQLDSDSVRACVASFCHKMYEVMKQPIYDPTSILDNLSNCGHELKIDIFERFLRLFLLDRGTTIFEVLSNVQKIRPIMNRHHESLITEITMCLDAEIIVNNVKEIILNSNDERGYINWNNLSRLIYKSVSNYNNFLSLFKTGVNHILEKSFEESKSSLLYAALLLGRIISLNEIGAGCSYLQWYASTFSSESHRPLNSVPRAKFFCSSMTSILDMEPPQFLKAHIHKAASVPASCQADLAEYLQLAKGRLISMNESVEMGLFENVSGSHASENDVACVVKQFEASGKISSKVLGALTFRRQYFEKVFLPTLLSSCPGKSSSHHAVITKLHGLGKISNALYMKHVKACDGNKL